MRMTAKARKAEILAAAMGLARERGFNRVLLTDVAKAAGCTHGFGGDAAIVNGEGSI